MQLYIRVSTLLFQILAIISRINQNIFALPFLHQRSDEKSIDELSKSVRENGYRSSDEILTDLERLFCWGEASGAQELTLINADQQRRFSLSGHEMERMAEEMRKNLALWVKETFAGEGGDEVRSGESDQIFEALVKRFPHLPQEELKVKSCTIAKDSQGGIWKTIVSKLDEANKNEDPNAVYKRFRLTKYEDDKKHMDHFYVAAYQFHKMALKWTATSTTTFHLLPLRTHSRPEDAIDHAELEKISSHLEDMSTTFWQSTIYWICNIRVFCTAF